MKKLLLIILLIVGCAPKPIMILDGETSSIQSLSRQMKLRQSVKLDVRHIQYLQMNGVIVCINVLEM